MTTKSMPFDDPPQGARLGAEDPEIYPEGRAARASEEEGEEGYGDMGHVSGHDLQEAADDFLSSLGDLTQTADAYVREQTLAHPYRTLGVAAGVGFVLGGGLASRATGLLLTVGGRLLVARFLEDMARREHEEAESRS